ncbi:MAG TPA: hypothetical protein VHZ97_00220 [Pseudonocardiaceae bacterium]|jgi:hypothetical protein|nr:hypothetical protein [Pseudonocardiaceae bacterium]
MGAVRRLIGFLLVVACGWLVAHFGHFPSLDHSPGYAYAVTALLGFGLYAATSGIDLTEFRSQLGTVSAAITVGVLAKTALITGVLYLVLHSPVAIVLGIAMAQIDPLSVSAMIGRSGLSPAGKSLLTAWASFDDPITVLLTAYAATFVFAGASSGSDTTSLLVNLGGSIGIAALALLLTRLRLPAWTRFLGVPLTIAVGAVAVWQSWLLGLALIGLFHRPRWLTQYLAGGTRIVYYAACFAMGFVLVGGARIGPGLLLGVATYGSQLVAAFALTVRKRWRGDRMRLALGQQNGLTAITLALLLEPVFPGATATIGVAVVVVSVLNVTGNAIWDHATAPAKPPAPVPVPVRAVSAPAASQ